jgi:hypothetical protein
MRTTFKHIATLFLSMTGCRNFQKKIERDVTFKTIFAIALSVFCLYLLKICAMVAFI